MEDKPKAELTPEQQEDMRTHGATIVDGNGQRVDPSDPRIAHYMATHKRVRDEIDVFRPSAEEHAAKREARKAQNTDVPA
jgi:hypothetical protein